MGEELFNQHLGRIIPRLGQVLDAAVAGGRPEEPLVNHVATTPMGSIARVG